jgi:hypothetical protein
MPKQGKTLKGKNLYYIFCFKKPSLENIESHLKDGKGYESSLLALWKKKTLKGYSRRKRYCRRNCFSIKRIFFLFNEEIPKGL